MRYSYRTDRLVLRIIEPNQTDAKHILDFHMRNDDVFQKYEPTHSEEFMTLDHQMKLLDAEMNAATRLSLIRFWVFLKSDPDTVIGTTSFRNISMNFERSCKIGYKLDKDYWHMGYMTEAVYRAIGIMFDEVELHRIVATIMPENAPSIALAKRLGFKFEGVERSSYMVNGAWEDHERWALISPFDEED